MTMNKERDCKLLEEVKVHIEKHKTITNIPTENPTLYLLIRNESDFNSDKKNQSYFEYFMVRVLDKIYGKDFDFNELFEKLPYYYWTEERIAGVLKRIIEEEGTINELSRLNPILFSYLENRTAKLSTYIRKIGYEMDDVYTRTPDGQFPRGYLAKFKNLKKEIEWIMEHHTEGRFPTNTEITRNFHIHDRVVAKHGGMAEIKRKMGFAEGDGYFLYAKDGHPCRSSYELITDNFLALNNIPHEREQRFSDKEDYRSDFLLIDGTHVEIWGFEDRKSSRHKNYKNRKRKKIEEYERLKIPLIQIDYSVFKSDFENMVKELSRIFAPYLAGEVKYDEDSIISDSFYSLKNLKEDVEPLMIDGEYLPSQTELYEMNRSDLVVKINSYGGYTRVAELLGLKNKRKKNEYWTKEYFSKVLIEETRKNNGIMPMRKELEEKFGTQFKTAAGRFGVYKIADEIGLKTKKSVQKQVNPPTKNHLHTFKKKVINIHNQTPFIVSIPTK